MQQPATVLPSKLLQLVHVGVKLATGPTVAAGSSDVFGTTCCQAKTAGGATEPLSLTQGPNSSRVELPAGTIGRSSTASAMFGTTFTRRQSTATGVRVDVLVTVGLTVTLGVGVWVAVRVSVGDGVDVAVGPVGVIVGVNVVVGVRVIVGVEVGVGV